MSVLDVHSVSEINSSFGVEYTLYINTPPSVIYFHTKSCLNLFFLSCSVCLCVSLKPERQRTPSGRSDVFSSLRNNAVACFDVLIGLDICCNLNPKCKKHRSFVKVTVFRPESKVSSVPTMLFLVCDLYADCPRKSRSDCSLWGL